MIYFKKKGEENMIEAINIEQYSKMNFYNKEDNKIKMLSNLSKVNIFIGENNCGKSRLMRSFLNNDLSIYSTDNIHGRQREYNSCISSLKNCIKQLKECKKDNLKEKVKNILDDDDDKETFYKINESFSQMSIIRDSLNRYNNEEAKLINCIDNIGQNIDYIKTYTLYPNGKTINKKDLVYIPILRGIENFEMYFKEPRGFDSIKMTPGEFKAFEEFKGNAKKIYKNKVSKSYSIDENKIFTAESLYSEIASKLLGDEINRNFIRDFEKFISDSFYNGIEFSITPNINKNYLGIKIGNNEDRALYDLGEGIKQLIVLFYKIFERKNQDTVFLIEEPELNLHPGFQRKFMEIITREFPRHQFFITTHSNHIIDLYSEKDNISLYKFRNLDKENSKFYLERVLPKDISILDEIGARNSSVFMSNCTIWVEGISDKIYIEKYLELYFKKQNITNYKEDIHYSFVEYGGNNITHWSFIDDNSIETINASSITHNIFIICDNDNNAKQTRKEKLRAIFGERLYILNSREIENILSKQVLEETLKKDNKIETLEYKRYKTEGYTEEKYAKPEVKIATFIDNTFDLKKKYAGECNALKNKADFAKKAIENMKSFDDLSQEAKDLTEKIVKFIKENN